MNPSTTQARVLVDELMRNGVHDVVLSPGSRNAPLSFALDRAARSGEITLHVRIDERSAGFFALGLAKGSGQPAVVVTTSGTAAVNLHPAIAEAQYSAVPLIAITADRPVELQRSGANQTMHQHDLYGIRTLHMPIAEADSAHNGVWRSLICRAVAMARESGAVHVNVPFREPLVPEEDIDLGPFTGRPAGQPWTTVAQRQKITSYSADHLGPRTLVLIGDGYRGDIAVLAAKAGWPVITEPTADVVGLPHGSLLLNSDLSNDALPDAVIIAGRLTLSRGVHRLIKQTPTVHVLSTDPHWPDPDFRATHVSTQITATDVDVDDSWLARWLALSSTAEQHIDTVLARETWPTNAHIARDMLAALPAGASLFLGSSNPIRDVDLVGVARPDITTFANRGLSGIDGAISSAMGIAATQGKTYALIGDLTFLHDSNGLFIGHGEPLPDITFVVLNDQGGGIFLLLEQGEPRYKASFERIFGTPHDVNLADLCAAYHIKHTIASTKGNFLTELSNPGPQVIEVFTNRQTHKTIFDRLATIETNID